MNEVATLELRRFGDVVSYRLEGSRLTVRGRHLMGSRYDLTFQLAELSADHQTYWIKNSRLALQLSLIVLFLVVFCVAIGWATMFPDSVKEHGGWFLGALSVSLVALFGSVFARRVEVAVFAYRSGIAAFRIPMWGCAPESRRAFLDLLSARIPREEAPASRG